MKTTPHQVRPQGIDAATFSRALADFGAVLGADQVLTSTAHLRPYTKIMMAVETEAHRPSAVLLATTVEQVQAVVSICNRYRIPLWPISTGRNFGYGSAAPGERGQVVLDLRRMNRILEIDPELCTALVEPGVTYQQLYDHLQEHERPLMLSFSAPSAIAGPVGNTLDRGVGYTPYGEHFLMQCGMEVVLANGEVLRTGMGGVEGDRAWQVFKWGYGPTLDGLFTQSNYGICTKMGFWLMPRPPVIKPFSIRYADDTDIADIVELLRPLRIAQVIPNAVVIAGTLWEAGGCNLRRSDYLDTPGSTPRAVIEQIRRDHGLGAWNVYAALYGTPEQVEVNWRIVTEAVERNGRGTLITAEEAGQTQPFQYRAELMSGIPNLQEFGLYNWRGGGGSMWFAPVSQARGSECGKQVELATTVLEHHGFDYVGEFIVGWRDMHHVIDLLYDRSDPEEMRRAHDCFATLLDVFEAEGYAVYRVNTAFQERVAQSYGPVKREVERTLKRALDPNGILAPGRCGIRG
ncbi:FAD-binding oxidoreductase [Marichromatium bheemlicum]|uniref:FAD-binding oxidoreductase n=1 Tax=Marichromatium bheemlicum TaxID=365339 RepID=A0ABX1I7U4_9GAMM|nr:FAD-binding oxidoreductase [Marichromatium bheemlicum]NKN32470.1 FAD-binding oxidoreductase [Marichromatium bheemlicum]